MFAAAVILSPTYTVSVHVAIMISTSASSVIYTLSLHDALPISGHLDAADIRALAAQTGAGTVVSGSYYREGDSVDRKSTRLNSSHRCISYAVFCLKKKR